MSVAEPWAQERTVRLAARLLESYRRLLGQDLIPAQGDAEARARALWRAPCAVVAHGTEADPILNYGNAAALALWELDWDAFTRMPSRLTAEAPRREERQRLLERVARAGYCDDYSGVRVSASGKRFFIPRATVWNVVDEKGEPCGQAAAFERWEAR
ncbi:MAG: MEKHLA domain-containing protein [Planctomycetota bacterium]|nr:MEKHLA domain-containing protein [Planctomycetota bacterium]